MKIAAIILFLLTYVALLLFPKRRHLIAMSTAIIFLILGIVPLFDSFSNGFGSGLSTIGKKLLTSFSDGDSWNVILMIAGTMGVVGFFIESKMPNYLADVIIDKVPNVKWAIISLSLFAGIISAFVDNVATVLMIAPVALTISKKLKISPVASIIAISISSNLQGAATLVGDTTSIILGKEANLTFFDFFFLEGKIGLFFVVQLAAIVSTLILLWLFRKEKDKVEIEEKTKVTDYFPSFLLLGIIVLLIIASFIPNTISITNGLICFGLYIIGLVRNLIKKKDKQVVKDSVKEIDYQTLILLFSLFIIIGGLGDFGVIQDIGNLFNNLGGNVFLIYTIIVWGSVIISAFIDNIPYVMTMLPVVGFIAAGLPGVHPNLLYFGLLIGATLGGNITPIGASANIAGLGILRKDGYEVKASTFMKISVPFTLTAVTVGYALIWFIWS